MSWFTDRPPRRGARHRRGPGCRAAWPRPADAWQGDVRAAVATRRSRSTRARWRASAAAMSLRARAGCAGGLRRRSGDARWRRRSSGWPRRWPMPAGAGAGGRARPFASTVELAAAIARAAASGRQAMPGALVGPDRRACWPALDGPAAARLRRRPGAVAERAAPAAARDRRARRARGQPRARGRPTAARGRGPAALAGRLARARSRDRGGAQSPSSWPPHDPHRLARTQPMEPTDEHEPA